MKTKTYKKKTYLILGFVAIVASIPFAFLSVIFGWYLLLGALMMFISGICYLLFGFNKLKKDHDSDTSVGSMIMGLIVGVFIPFLIVLYIQFSGMDSMGGVLAVPFVFVGFFITFWAFILIVKSVSRSIKQSHSEEEFKID